MSYTLNAKAREVQGKGASRRLRRLEQALPAIIYGGGKEPQNIAIEQKDLFKAMEDEGFFSSIIKLNIDGDITNTIIKDLQRHPAKAIIYHADFLRVDDSQAIVVNVPLHFTNQEACVGTKLEGGRLTINATTLEVQCLPSALPEYLEIDLTDVHIDTILHISDIELPEGVEAVALQHGADHDQPIAQVTSIRGGALEEDDLGEADAEAGDEEAGDEGDSEDSND